MDCVVRVILGPDKGQEFKLPPGPQVVGRGARAQLRVTQEDVSYEHALITRENDEYFVENLSAVGTWIGDARVAGKTRLRVGDKIRLSPDCVLQLDPADGSSVGSLRVILAVALVFMLGGVVAVAFYSNDGPKYVSTTDNWSGAHDAIASWAMQSPGNKRVSPAAVDLFKQAWRVDQTGNYDQSKKTWLKLQILLASEESQLRGTPQLVKDDQAAVKKPALREASLQSLLTPTIPPRKLSDDEMAAALLQFVRRRLDWAIRNAGGGGLGGMGS